MTSTDAARRVRAGARAVRLNRATLVWMHRWLGLLAALPLIVVMGSGSLLALAPEIDSQLSAGFYHDPARPDLPLDGILVQLQAYDPQLNIAHLGVPDEPGSPFVVFGRTDGEFVKLFVNSASGEVFKAPGQERFVRWLEMLHRNLTVGKPGRYVVGVATTILAILAASGLYLWWPMRRQLLRRVLQRADALSWHNLIGLVAAPFFLMVAATGVTLTFHQPVMGFVRWVTASPPVPAPPTVASKGRDKGSGTTQQLIGMEAALKVVATAYPRAHITAFGEPRNAGDPYKVRIRYPQQWHPMGWQRIYVHPYAPQILGSINFYEHSPATAYGKGWHVWHTGKIFGTPGRWLWSLLSAAGTAVLVTGVLFWWRRRRRRGGPE